MKTTYSRAIIACASIATAATAIELTTEAQIEYKTCTDVWRYHWDKCYGAETRMPCDWEDCSGVGWYFWKVWSTGPEEWCVTY